ncbi:ABC transporter permease [Treponema sp. OMZ 840]|uniref:ABC transporter permease n=1 Tax=Treponema sp. OMZ 840 TaxID=244313 RepID=UPI003D93CE40
MFEDFINALQNFKTNKTRTFLSLLGIVIGVTAVVIVTTMASSLDASMKRIFSRFTLDMMILEHWQIAPRKLPFNEEFRRELTENVDGIKNIFYFYDFNERILRTNFSTDARISACEQGAIEANRYEIDYGTSLLPADFANGAHKVVLGKSIAETLFPEGNAVGKTITLNTNKANFTLTVAGVLKHKDVWTYSPDRTIFIPRTFVSKKIKPVQRIFRADIQLINENDADKVSRLIRDYTDKKTGVQNALWVSSAKSMLQENNKILVIVNIVLTSIAAISLLVGGIGIMNIMIVTVTERKHEIGMRKALGASNADIRNQFLVESATLTLTGGTVGVILGILICFFVINFVFPKDFEFVFAFNLTGTIVAFIVSVSTGIFFGLNPALKAAHLDPVEALSD